MSAEDLLFDFAGAFCIAIILKVIWDEVFHD